MRKPGKIPEPREKFGSLPPVTPSIPAKPKQGQGPSGTHGSYKQGNPVGKVINK